MKPRILEPAWLREHEVVRIEYVSYGHEGTVWDHLSYGVGPDGEMNTPS